ncbi:fatty acyl-CoA reductase 2, chloroplastic-like [Phoenix dactylifera]|uniref:Fatty acyl-CoA reductase n=1 Tax=Phoenix dactylifera TaxID=42345 RepID=A0A8B8ZK34_PHODC|nr:fatty acyl-CoA reductase 2, chloroplastic-like [Phoenix dactylifera]
MGSSCLNSSRTVLERPTSFSFDKQRRPCPTSGFSWLMRKKHTNIVRCQGNGNVRNPNGYPPVVTERPAAATVTEDHMVFSSNVKIRKDVGMMDLTSYKETTAPGTSETYVSEGIGIVRFLRGKKFLITGATGFLGKVLIEKILRTNTDVSKIYVLIKAKDKEAAMERLKCEIVNTELFRSLKEIHGSNYQAFMLRKLIPVVGNVREANLGLEAGLADEISEEVDVIINSAANTTFDERYDVALDINTIGPCRIMSFAKRFKRLKLFLHVSTAYVNGQRQGRILEKPFLIGDTLATETSFSEFSAKSTPLLDIETEIKLALDSKKTSHYSSTTQEMKDLGLERAKIHGWQDTYVFTKAMGEMVVNCMRGDIPVVTIRPSVIESACKEPFPGWMEGNRMMDPIVLYYGKGQLTGFLADPNGVLDVVPVDMVVNATLAAMAKHGSSREPGMHIYQIASSVINPLVFKDLARLLFEHFKTFPCMDPKGRPITVHPMKLFSDMNEFSSYVWMDASQRSGRVTAAISHEKLSKRLQNKCMRSVEQAKYLANIYEPYTFYGGRFDNANTQKLMEEMSEEERTSFDFNVGSISWKDYISNVHIPGLRRHVMKGRGMCTKSQLVGTTV